jgi:hypothetical protein
VYNNVFVVVRVWCVLLLVRLMPSGCCQCSTQLRVLGLVKPRTSVISLDHHAYQELTSICLPGQTQAHGQYASLSGA